MRRVRKIKTREQLWPIANLSGQIFDKINIYWWQVMLVKVVVDMRFLRRGTTPISRKTRAIVVTVTLLPNAVFATSITSAYVTCCFSEFFWKTSPASASTSACSNVRSRPLLALLSINLLSTSLDRQSRIVRADTSYPARSKFLHFFCHRLCERCIAAPVSPFARELILNTLYRVAEAFQALWVSKSKITFFFFRQNF